MLNWDNTTVGNRLSLKLDLIYKIRVLLQNKLLTYLWYLNLGCTLRDLEVI